MRKVVESITQGEYKINIYQDEFCESPDQWGDGSLFLVGYHQDFWAGTKEISENLAQCITRSGKYEDGSTCQEAKDYLRKYHVFGLEAYIQSGVALSLSREGNSPDRAWDVSQLGLVFVSKKEWRTKAKAKEAAKGLIDTWNLYLSGSVYGYMIRTPEGEEEGGCWGFYGYDHKESGLLDAANEDIESLEEKRKEIVDTIASMVI